MANRATWGVVATVDEPLALICAFAGHYLALGAEVVWLFLDRDRPDVLAALAGRDAVRLTVCDAAFWAAHRHNGRPALVSERQRFLINVAYRMWTADWLLHCDTDEFLLSDTPVGEVLASLPAKAAFATTPMAERQWLRGAPPGTIFDGVLRLATPGDRTRRDSLAGLARDTLNDRGLLSHFGGKSVVRRGQRLKMGIHFPDPPGPKVPQSALEDWRAARGCVFPGRLAHFDGLTPLHWVLKMLRIRQDYAAAQPGMAGDDPRILDYGPIPGQRKAQVRLVHALRADPAALARELEALLTLTPAQVAHLRDAGIVAPVMPDLAGQTARIFPDQADGLQADRFDRSLRAQHAGLIAATGLAL